MCPGKRVVCARTGNLTGGRQHEAKSSYFVTLRMNLR